MIAIRQPPPPRLGQIDPLCSLISADFLPIGRDIIQRTGCSQAARAVAAAEIAKRLSPEGGAPSAWAQMASTVGPELVVGCMCRALAQREYVPGYSPAPVIEQPWYTQPLVLGGLAIAGLALVAIVSSGGGGAKSKRGSRASDLRRKKSPAGKFSVVVGGSRNPDFPNDPPTPATTLTANTLEGISSEWNNFRGMSGIGGGAYYGFLRSSLGAIIRDPEGRPVGRLAYNGKIFDIIDIPGAISGPAATRLLTSNT